MIVHNLKIFIILLTLQTLMLNTDNVNAATLDDFTHESSLSVVAGQGNSPFATYNAAVKNDLIFDKAHHMIIGGHYTLSTINAEEVEIARNWNFNTKYLVLISKTSEAFIGASSEGDEFAGYSERNNIDIGLNTRLIDKDEFHFNIEYGYRSSVEVSTDGTGADKDEKLRFYLYIDEKLGENISYAFWVEYISNLTTDEDYMINFEPSFRVSLTKIFFLKLSYKGMYDNQPAVEGRKYLDTYYTTSLLAKF